jgi:hypothetical protein
LDSYKNLKEQNISIVSQIANMLPETATGFDLNRVFMNIY